MAGKLLRKHMVALVAALTVLVMGLVACGGGSSTGGENGSGNGSSTSAVLAGTVNDGLAAVIDPGQERALIARLTEALVPTAHAAVIPGVTVELLDESGNVVATQITSNDGTFLFAGLSPGLYSLRLSQGSTVLGETPQIDLLPGAFTRVEISTDGDGLVLVIEGEGDSLGGTVGEGNEDGSEGEGDENCEEIEGEPNCDDQEEDCEQAEGEPACEEEVQEEENCEESEGGCEEEEA